MNKESFISKYTKVKIILCYVNLSISLLFCCCYLRRFDSLKPKKKLISNILYYFFEQQIYRKTLTTKKSHSQITYHQSLSQLIYYWGR